jgi:hypothetical protein
MDQERQTAISDDWTYIEFDFINCYILKTKTLDIKSKDWASLKKYFLKKIVQGSFLFANFPISYTKTTNQNYTGSSIVYVERDSNNPPPYKKSKFNCIIRISTKSKIKAEKRTLKVLPTKFDLMKNQILFEKNILLPTVVGQERNKLDSQVLSYILKREANQIKLFSLNSPRFVSQIVIKKDTNLRPRLLRKTIIKCKGGSSITIEELKAFMVTFLTVIFLSLGLNEFSARYFLTKLSRFRERKQKRFWLELLKELLEKS